MSLRKRSFFFDRPLTLKVVLLLENNVEAVTSVTVDSSGKLALSDTQMVWIKVQNGVLFTDENGFTSLKKVKQFKILGQIKLDGTLDIIAVPKSPNVDITGNVASSVFHE